MRDLSRRWSSSFAPINVWEIFSYCSSRNNPALEAVAVVKDFVVVSASKRYARSETLCESGVDVKPSNEESSCERSVVLPDPDSPLFFSPGVSIPPQPRRRRPTRKDKRDDGQKLTRTQQLDSPPYRPCVSTSAWPYSRDPRRQHGDLKMCSTRRLPEIRVKLLARPSGTVTPDER